jgi:thiol-disulfide isomerase/thioredoxin
MKSVRMIVGVLLLMVSITACDIIDDPIQSGGITPPDTTLKFIQKVLIEDYTGHTCGNCPEAAEEAERIAETFGKDRVIVVGVHSGPFALPRSDYPTDWRTAEGEEMDQTFRISRAGNPNGLVSRTEFNNKFILSMGNWDPATSALLAKEAALGIELTPTWDATTKTVNVDAKLTFIKEGTTDYHIVGWVIENKLIGDQLDYRQSPSHVKDFKFEHVLRASMNGTWGEPITTEVIAAGATKNIPLSFTFPAGKDWKPENCEVVVYVHKHGTTREIVQVEKIKVVK